MRTLALIAALALAGCGLPTKGEMVCRAESLHRHHGQVQVGPRATWRNGVSLHVWGGHQFPIWEPGEPHVSDRAPENEFQAGVEVVVPLW